jgi:predicted MPP superfamily phosphohydrolase
MKLHINRWIKIAKRSWWPVFSIMSIVFLIFLSQYLKKAEIREITVKNSTEGLEFAEQKAGLNSNNFQQSVGVSPVDEKETGVENVSNDSAVKSDNSNDESDAAIDESKKDTETAVTDEAKKETPRAALIIGLIADAHSGQEYGFVRLNSAVWSLRNYTNPDIVIDLGDLIESRFKYKNIKKKAAEADFVKARNLISRYFPTYHVIGNHEVLSLSKDNMQNLTGRKNYFSFKVKGYNLIILDANYTKDGRIIDAAHDETFIYNGMLPDKQLDWLDGQLKNNDNNLIFIHHPPYELDNESDFEDVIRKNRKRIILIANGHHHASILRIATFAGVKLYDIPSAYFQKTHATIRINGRSATVTAR